MQSRAAPDTQEPGPDFPDEASIEQLWAAASGQKMLIWSFVLTWLLNILTSQGNVPEMVTFALYFGIMYYFLLGVARVCTGLGKSQNQKILLMVLALIPLFNIVLVIWLSIRATRALRAAGWQVGLLGAKP